MDQKTKEVVDRVRKDLKERGITEFHYYTGRAVSVTLLLQGEVIRTRGLAVKSPRDPFSKQVGMVRSLLRAYKALNDGGSSKPILRIPPPDHPLNQVRVDYSRGYLTQTCKSCFLPEPTQLEKELLYKFHNSHEQD